MKAKTKPGLLFLSQFPFSHFKTELKMNNLNVLIVDDEESQIQSLKGFLLRRNYSVFTAVNGIEGIKIVNSNQMMLY